LARPASAGGQRPAPLRWAEVLWTDRSDGDLSRAAAPWDDVAGRPVARVRQVHGDRVAVVEGPGGADDVGADALVTTVAGTALAVVTADCAPVALASPEGVVAAAHAGWAGLYAGILERTVEAMRSLGATAVEAALGPCIHAECYEFGADAVARLAGRLGPAVAGVTAGGRSALDVPAAVRAALEGAGASLVHDEDVCTACAADRCFSHRARRDAERQAMVVWRE
jgi:YfiH family protein